MGVKKSIRLHLPQGGSVEYEDVVDVGTNFGTIWFRTKRSKQSKDYDVSISSTLPFTIRTEVEETNNAGSPVAQDSSPAV